MSDFTFEDTSVCGKSDNLEALLACNELKKSQKTALIVFLNVRKPNDMLIDYKKHLKKSVK